MVVLYSPHVITKLLRHAPLRGDTLQEFIRTRPLVLRLVTLPVEADVVLALVVSVFGVRTIDFGHLLEKAKLQVLRPPLKETPLMRPRK